MPQIWSKRRGRSLNVSNRADISPTSRSVAGIGRRCVRRSDGRVLQFVRPERAICQRSTAAIARHIAIVPAPSDIGNADTSAEAEAGEWIGVGSAADAVGGNPTMGIAIKAVVEIHGAMKRDAQRRPQITAGEWCGPLAGEGAIGRRSGTSRGVVELSIVAVPCDAESGSTANGECFLFNSQIRVHFYLVNVALVIRDFDPNAGRGNGRSTCNCRDIEPMPEVRVEISDVVGLIIDRAD